MIPAETAIRKFKECVEKINRLGRIDFHRGYPLLEDVYDELVQLVRKSFDDADSMINWTEFWRYEENRFLFEVDDKDLDNELYHEIGEESYGADIRTARLACRRCIQDLEFKLEYEKFSNMINSDDLKFNFETIEAISEIIKKHYSGERISGLFSRAGFGADAVATNPGAEKIAAAINSAQDDLQEKNALVRIIEMFFAPIGGFKLGDNREALIIQANKTLVHENCQIDSDSGKLEKVMRKPLMLGRTKLFNAKKFHSDISSAVKRSFYDGCFDDCLMNAWNAYEKALQKKSGYKESGHDLINKALGVGKIVRFTENEHLKGGKDWENGIKNMVIGLHMGTRNVVAHQHEGIFDPDEHDVFDILCAYDFLFRQLDRAKIAKDDSGRLKRGG